MTIPVLMPAWLQLSGVDHMGWLWPWEGADVPIRIERGAGAVAPGWGDVPCAEGDGETRDGESPLAMTIT